MELLSRTGTSSWRSSMWWLPDGRESVQCMTLRVLLAASRLQVPLAPVVRQLASEQSWLAGRRLRLLANRLENGTPFVDALEQTPGILAEEDVLTLRLASQSGTVEKSFELLNEKLVQPVSPLKVTFLQTLVYLVFLMVSILLVFAFLMTFIAPMFRELFEEFGLRWPGYAGAKQVSDVIWNMIPVALAGLLVMAIVEWRWRPLRFVRNSLASRMLRGTADLRTVHLLRLLGLTLREGRPVAGALSTLARYHFDANVRSKLLFARNETEQGSSVWVGLSDAGLLRAHEAQALQLADGAAFRVWLLNRLADQRSRQVERRRAVWLAWLHPLVIIAAACVVGWIVTTFFSPLIIMIHSLG